MPATLYTIGHSTHPVAYFAGLLEQHGVTAICDVRSHPYSRYNPQYNREEIAEAIKKYGIHYVFLGKELGARSENANCYMDGKMQFKRLSTEPLFQQGLARLKKGMDKYAIALMCAEKDPLTCHRTILVARQLRLEYTIEHILEDGSIESNAEAETRLQTKLNICPDLARNENQCIEESYDLQGQKIAYVNHSFQEKA